MIDRLFGWMDDRLHVARFTRSALNKIFPDNWSFMLGEIALYCFVILVLTGIYLSFFFTPSAREVVYHGSYAALRGQPMSEAYQSTVKLSFDVRAGLVFRQMHHWAALIFVGAVLVHLLRIFFTGAFRRPRELNWLIGVTLLLLVIFNGFAGYSLPDDLLSGTGLRIGYSIALAVPVIGTWIAFLLFGGEFPAPDIVARLFVLHIFLIPALIAGLLGAHLAILWRQKHTQFPGPGRTEENIVGSKLWPTYTARSIGLFAGVFALIAFLGGLAQINPIWLYGPFKPAAVTTASQPDWYMGWLEGALRLAPGWRIHVFGYTISEVFWPGAVLPTVTFVLLYLWPFIERWVTHDTAPHQLLDRPRNRPVRTAIGIGSLTFYVVLFLAGSQDIGAQRFATAIPTITQVLRVMLAVLPPVAAIIAWKMCHDLSAADELEAEKHRIQHRQGGGPHGPQGPPTATETEAPPRKVAAAGATEGKRSGGFLAIVGAVLIGVVRLFGGRKRARTRSG
ncbi:MAG TPA: cytochrome bc complex cytochrome b subunit [Actinomycetota bacterium]|nr:cytochrome bc complex cytochrome b subunit [Actinomycetota bacterium]